QKVSFLFGIANNRKVSIERGTSLPVKDVELPAEGLMVYLKAFGWVKVFCQPFKNEPRYYILYQPALDVLQQTGRETFKAVHDDHWQIECFHRVIKQVCNIERFYVRDEQAIRNHFFCALRAFCQLQTMCINGVINNCYEISRQLFVPVIRQFILEHLAKSALASPHLGCPVNA
ncbi:MAG: transposase, partial [Cyanobacteria bacterium J06627_15]